MNWIEFKKAVEKEMEEKNIRKDTDIDWIDISTAYHDGEVNVTIDEMTGHLTIS